MTKKNESGAKKEAPRAKNMMYVQQIEHLPAKTLDNLVDTIVKKLKPKKFAAILHDMDIDVRGNLKAPHIHVMLSFANARSVNSIAKLLCDDPQYIEVWQGNANNGYSYLIHATADAADDYQYDPAKVIASFDYIAEIQSIQQQVSASKYRSNVNTLLDLLLEGLITINEAEQRLSGSQYAQNHRKFEVVEAKRLQNEYTKWRKEMIAQGKPIEVVWLYGETETGKTRLSFVLAEQKGQPYCLSGSSRDIFQTYDGEHTFILDELRPNTIPYHDLLRITDPFGKNVMAPSRFRDKAVACDLIIITSPYDPYSFYQEQFKGNKNIDAFGQLLRRIASIKLMTQEHIIEMVYDKDKKEFLPMTETAEINKYSKLGSRTVIIGPEEMVYPPIICEPFERRKQHE